MSPKFIEDQAPSAEPAANTPAYQHGSVSPAREQTNPLRSLTISRAISLMESAQRGDFLELEWLYWFIEQTDPILIALQERRYGRLAEMDWESKIIPRQRRRSSFDQTLADEQAAALAEQYDRIDNLKDAIEHLASATFRLYAHVNIQRDPAGAINHLEPLDQWNFLRAGMFGDWYWNPTANVTHWQALPIANRVVPQDFIIRTVGRHINRPGLIKYIRKALAEKDWSGFVEIYGQPTPDVIMPQGATDSQKSSYEAAGIARAQGRCVAWPNGTQIDYPAEVRGNAPFAEYLKWCDEQMVLSGTGGLLSMLSMPTGIGSGASATHDAAFQSIARAEAFRISELFQRQLDKPFLAQAFPGKPILAYFEIAAQESTDPGTILDHAGKAKTAGFQMDPADVAERTGYKLTLLPPPPAPVGTPPLPAAMNTDGAAPVCRPGMYSARRGPSRLQDAKDVTPTGPLERLLQELESLIEADDPDAIQAWIDALPKRAADLNLGGEAEALARAMEAAAVQALADRLEDGSLTEAQRI
jgi:phage gp29-like protein